PRIGDYVFGNEHGRVEWSWYRTKFETARRIVKEQHGLKHFRFHDIRHSFSNYVRKRGYDFKAISLLLGHTTTAMMDMVYSDPTEKEKRAAVETLPRGIFEIANK